MKDFEKTKLNKKELTDLVSSTTPVWFVNRNKVEEGRVDKIIPITEERFNVIVRYRPPQRPIDLDKGKSGYSIALVYSSVVNNRGIYLNKEDAISELISMYEDKIEELKKGL